MDIEQRLRQYIVENFMYSGDVGQLTADYHLFENGVIDSTGVLELVSFLEQDFGVKVEDSELVPENFATVASLAAFVARKSDA
ncbi:MAG: acyl carrier protein [Deltaproteobacteria bacterium]|nr:acyl carrier protein [Deltaproteobacteria bacterium]